MPGKRPRQIQRTTSMSQLGGGGMALGAPHRGLSAPAKQGLLETMEVCTGVDDAVVPGAFMEDTFSSMAIDDSVEESSYASHAVRPGVSNQANYPWVQHQSLHAGYSQQVSPNKAMAPQAGVYRGHETGRSAQPAHFLDVCYLCSKRLGHGRDVFIYRGDRAFCSVECRHAQIVADEKRENCGMAAAKEGGQALNAPARNPPNTKQVETAVAG